MLADAKPQRMHGRSSGWITFSIWFIATSIVSIFALFCWEEFHISQVLLGISSAAQSGNSEHLVDVGLVDAWSLQWWMTRLMLLVPPTSTTEHGLGVSQIIHHFWVFHREPIDLLGLLCSELLKKLDLLSDGSSLVDPVIRLINLCLESWFVH